MPKVASWVKTALTGAIESRPYIGGLTDRTHDALTGRGWTNGGHVYTGAMAMYPNELDIGADVFSSDGLKLGELHRVVVRRADLSVSHIVVDIGLLRSGRHLWAGGFGLDYDRIVPVADVQQASSGRVSLRQTGAAFKDAPEYSVESFEPAQDMSPDDFDIPDIVNRAQQLAGLINSVPNGWLVERRNLPLDSVDLPEGAPVWRLQPHQKLGDLDRVIIDATSGQARAFVIKRGVMLTHDVILPARYVSELLDGIIRVEISDSELKQLQRYEPSS